MKSRGLFISAVLGVSFVSSAAIAQDQPWLQDRKYTEGMGYRVGDLEIHPGVAAEFGYDSNYFKRSDDEDPIGALRLRVTPSLSLSTISPKRREATPEESPPAAEFRAGVSATYNEFIGVSGSQEGKDAMSDQRNVGGNLNLNLDILPRRPWSLSVLGSVERMLTASESGLSSENFNRIRAAGGGDIVWTPGGGLLDWRLGYRFGGTFFESDSFQSLNSMEHSAQTRGRWKFLPRSSIIYDGKFGFISYPSSDASKTASHPVRTQIGFNGLISSSFAVLALGGWGASFYQGTNDEDFDSVIGQLELRYFITPNPSANPQGATMTVSSLAAGFTRDFQDSYIGTFVERDRGYINVSYFFSGQLLLVLDGGVGPVIYPDIPSLNLSSFSDTRVDASAFVEYRFMDSLGLNTTVRYGSNLSDTELSLDGSDGGGDSLQWQQIEAYLGLRWLM